MPEGDLKAGSAAVDITPKTSVFLHGYPHVKRYSTGVHDPLYASALCLESAGRRLLIVASDVIYVSRQMVLRARKRIAEQTGIAEADIMLSATHTHSGPKMLDPIATAADSVVPPTDQSIVAKIEDGIVAAAKKAAANLRPAEIGLAVADATGVGTNRRDPAGPRDLNVPILLVRDEKHKPIAAMLVCSMHPTVLHENSTLITGDFPSLTRRRLQHLLHKPDCPILYHTGPAGDQSPRHVTTENTFAEAKRLGYIVGDAVNAVMPSIEFQNQIELDCRSTTVSLPLRKFPPEAEAKANLERAVAQLAKLRKNNAAKTQIRTAEVDWFGAQETVSLAKANAQGKVAKAAATCMPAEIQVMKIGPWNFIAWPGEMFVEFALEIKRKVANSFVISYANGELQGYLVTKKAAEEGGYESNNAIFQSPQGGEMLVKATLDLLE